MMTPEDRRLLDSLQDFHSGMAVTVQLVGIEEKAEASFSATGCHTHLVEAIQRLLCKDKVFYGLIEEAMENNNMVVFKNYDN